MEYKKGPERGLIFRMGYHPQTAAVAVAVAVDAVASYFAAVENHHAD